jgi:hypothetical protein
MVFSPVQASIEGFRFIRDRPRPVTIWMLALLALNLAATAFNLSPWAQRLKELRTSFGFDWSVAAFADLAVHLLPAIIIALFLTFASLCIIAPSIFRVMLGQTRSPVFRLGADEARMFWLFLAVLVLITLAAVPSGVLLGYSRVYAGRLADTVGLRWIVPILSQLVSFLLFAFIVLRSSLAALIEVDTHKLDIRASWDLTRGHFWRMLAAALLAFLLVMLVILSARGLFYVLGTVIAFASGIDQQQFHDFVWPPPEAGVLVHFGPGPIMWKVILAAEQTVGFCVACGSLVYAYRTMSGRGDEPPAWLEDEAVDQPV